MSVRPVFPESRATVYTLVTRPNLHSVDVDITFAALCLGIEGTEDRKDIASDFSGLMERMRPTSPHTHTEPGSQVSNCSGTEACNAHALEECRGGENSFQPGRGAATGVPGSEGVQAGHSVGSGHYRRGSFWMKWSKKCACD